MSNRSHVSIVIPCYQDAGSMEVIFDRLGAVMDDMHGSELILVDDGSTEGTGRIAEKHAQTFRHPVTVIKLARNFGQQPAVFAGLAAAEGDTVVTLDSDLQYPPEQIPELIDGLAPEWPAVSGFRADRKDPWVRRAITGFMSAWLRRRTGTQLRDFGSMFRAYDRSVVDQLLTFGEQRRYLPALIAWMGVPVREIPVRHESRGPQASRYRLGSLIDMFFDLITGHSLSPLRPVTLAGLVGAGLGFIASLVLLAYRVAIGQGVSGLVSTVAALFLLQGIVLMILALLSEYVGRIYIETRGRPYYVVRETTRNF